MEYMEFLESLVNAESEDDRMSIVKEHSEDFKPVEGENLQPKLDELSSALEEANETITGLKQEIKERFFGRYDDGNENDEPKENEETEELDDQEKTINDLGFGQKTY